MPTLGYVRLSRKLPLLFVCFSLGVSMVVLTIGYLNFRSVLIDDARTLFEVISREREKAIEQWTGSIAKDVNILVKNPGTIEAAVDLTYGWRDFDGDPYATFQDTYIRQNPHPADQRFLLGEPVVNLFRRYDFAHAKYHPFFVEFQQQNGYDDLYIFSPEGDLIYSVGKGSEYATSFETGAFVDSGLGRAMTRARDGAPGSVVFEDFSPYAPAAGAPAAFVAAPLHNDFGVLVGVVALQMPVSRLLAIVNDPAGLGSTGQLILIGPDGRSRNSSRIEGQFGLYAEIQPRPQVRAALAGQETVMIGEPGQSGNAVMAITGSTRVFDRTWAIVAETDMNEILASARELRFLTLLLNGAAAAIVTGLGWMVARSIVRPIQRVSAAMVAVSEGDYAVDVPETMRRDEVGEMARVLSETKEKLAVARRSEEDRAAMLEAQGVAIDTMRSALTHLASGDLSRPITAEVPAEFEALKSDFNRAVDALNGALGQVLVTASSIDGSAAEFSTSSDDLARRTEEQAATLEDSSLELNQMTDSVASGAASAREAMVVIREARSHADNSRDVVRAAIGAMDNIRNSSDRMRSIVDVMDDIAFQTNLLAINAGIEAASAGELGRGFAVVAAEVRALALRSAEASREISDLIRASDTEVQTGESLVGETGTALVSIAEEVDHITDLVSKITAGSEEQAASISAINGRIKQLGGVTQQNAAMVEEFNAASQLLRQDVSALVDLIGQFTIRADGAARLPRPAATPRGAPAGADRAAPAPESRRASA